jgi:hypothetical protein
MLSKAFATAFSVSSKRSGAVVRKNTVSKRAAAKTHPKSLARAYTTGPKEVRSGFES